MKALHCTAKSFLLQADAARTAALVAACCQDAASTLQALAAQPSLQYVYLAGIMQTASEDTAAAAASRTPEVTFES